MPGQKISEADLQKIDPKFICTVCGLLLCAPMQTPCGHLMCFVCLQTLLSCGNRTCPVDGTQLSKDNVFLDGFTRRDIWELHLHCANEGCDWSGTYKDLSQDHLKNCDHALIQCVHGQCKKEIKRSLLAQHLQEECLYREIICDHCKEKLPSSLLQKHVDFECLETPLTCQHCGLADIPRKDLAKHEQVECEEIPIECVFKAVGCDHPKVSKGKELPVHQSNGLMMHLGLLLRYVLGMFGKVEKQVVSLTIEVKGLSQKFVSTLKTVAGLEKKVEDLVVKVEEGRNDVSKCFEVKIRKVENENQENKSTIERLRARLDQVDHSLALTTVTLSDIDVLSQGQSVTSTNGTLLWKIDNFTGKRQDAVSGVQTAIYSPPFYSSQFGYKMCAKVYMNGDGFGKGTHISLFFVVMKGEHDALLPWPFQKKITMMLLDQNNGEHIINAFRSDPGSSSFQRPTNNMNVAAGSPLFMPLDGLRYRGYVKDGTMFFKFAVEGDQYTDHLSIL